VCLQHRERLDDLPLLAQAFVTEFARELGKAVVGVSEEALAVLQAHRWPGNVRELRNVMERATIVARDRFIVPADLAGFGATLGGDHPARSAAPSPQNAGTPRPQHPELPEQASMNAPGLLSPGMTVDEAERQLITITLAHTGGNKTKAAAMLGISLKTLHNKLAREAAKPPTNQS